MDAISVSYARNLRQQIDEMCGVDQPQGTQLIGILLRTAVQYAPQEKLTDILRDLSQELGDGLGDFGRRWAEVDDAEAIKEANQLDGNRLTQQTAEDRQEQGRRKVELDRIAQTLSQSSIRT